MQTFCFPPPCTNILAILCLDLHLFLDSFLEQPVYSGAYCPRFLDVQSPSKCHHQDGRLSLLLHSPLPLHSQHTSQISCAHDDPPFTEGVRRGRSSGKNPFSIWALNVYVYALFTNLPQGAGIVSEQARCHC